MREESKATGPLVEEIQVPERIRALLRQVTGHFAKHGKFVDNGVTLKRRLTKKQRIAYLLFLYGLAPAMEIFHNLNMVLKDLDRLAADPDTHEGDNPLSRYKILIRLFFYEFARFEDQFGRYLFVLERLGQMTKAERRAAREMFYDKWAAMLRTRNVMLHSDFNWVEITIEAALLSSAPKMNLVKIGTGESLLWRDVLTPLCKQRRADLYEAAAAMRTIWNMLIADTTHGLAVNDIL